MGGPPAGGGVEDPERVVEPGSELGNGQRCRDCDMASVGRNGRKRIEGGRWPSGKFQHQDLVASPGGEFNPPEAEASLFGDFVDEVVEEPATTKAKKEKFFKKKEEGTETDDE